MAFTFCAALIYALTGGPSSGKTSIIQELEKKGEAVIHEAATDNIVNKLALGFSEPWKEQEFPLEVLEMQLKREEPWLSKEGRVFVDRGVFDVCSFAMTYKLAETKTLASMNKILDQIDLSERYKAIFFIMPHSENFSPLQTEVRSENLHEADKLQFAAYAIYCRHPHFIVVPGRLSPQQRAEWILEKIHQMKDEL